jgi:hypothetical protein
VADIHPIQEPFMSAGNRNPRPGRREPADDGGDADAGDNRTPSTDMQPEDAGTPDSGNAGGAGAGRGTAAESAMKQTSKTGNETGSKR